MNILITGASKGIGYETALLLSKDKSNTVIALSRSGYRGPNPNNNIHSYEYDLQKSDVEQNLLRQIKKHASHIDILINNAGTLILKPFDQLSGEDWQTTFEVNVFGPVSLIKTLLPMMGKGSHIVNISSMGGFQGSVKFPGLSAYSSSKAAIANITECLAVELKPRAISVNCLCLGGVQTEMFEQAFPGAKASTSVSDMAKYLYEFSLHAHKTMNGKVIPVSLSTP